MKIDKKIAIPTGISATALIAALVVGLSQEPVSTESGISAKIATANKYINELDYVQAIAEFESILDIDPKNVQAYLGLSQAYLYSGDTENALKALEKGYEQTGDSSIYLELLRLREIVFTETVTQTSISETTLSEFQETIQTTASESLTFTKTVESTLTSIPEVVTTVTEPPVFESESSTISTVTVPSLTFSQTMSETTATTVQTTTKTSITTIDTTVTETTTAPSTTTTKTTTIKKKKKAETITKTKETEATTTTTTPPIVTTTAETTPESTEDTLDAALLRARTAEEKGETQAALDEYEGIISSYPDCVDAYLELSEIYVGMNRYEDAIKLLKDGYLITGDERLLDAARKINDKYGLNMFSETTITTPYIPSSDYNPSYNNRTWEFVPPYNNNWDVSYPYHGASFTPSN